MSDARTKHVIEAVLLASGKPMTLEQLLGLFGDGERPERSQLREVIAELRDDYAERGIELVEVASGYRIQVKQSMEPWVSRLTEEKPARYSRALLETLALIAYRQPITRGEIEDIRGVSVSSSIVKTLQEREWVRVVGHRDVPGRPAMYGTTRRFLDYFNLKGLDDLPTLMELRDIDTINVELDLAVPGEEATAETKTGAPSDEARADSGELATVVQIAAETSESEDTIH